MYTRSCIFAAFTILLSFSSSYCQKTGKRILPASFQNDYDQTKPTSRWRWDTLVFAGNAGGGDYQTRITAAYDDQGNMTIHKREYLSGSKWVNYAKKEYIWNHAGKEIMEIDYGWQNNTWINFWKYVNEYDSAGLLKDNLIQMWDSSAWKNDRLTTYKYDSLGLIITEISKNWTGTDWTPWTRVTNYYDSVGHCINRTVEEDQGNGLSFYSRELWSYDSSGRIQTRISQYWGNYSWQNSYRYTYIYDASGNVKTFLTEGYDIFNGWDPFEKDEYTYNESGQVSDDLYCLDNLSGWYCHSDKQYSYDSAGNLISILIKRLESDTWTNHYRYSYSYDDYRNSLTGKSEAWYNGIWNLNQVDLNVYSGVDIVQTYLGCSYAAHFSDLAEGIPGLTNHLQRLKVFPNPASFELYIEDPKIKGLYEVSVTDLSGREQIHSRNSVFPCRINISGLCKGFYFITLRSTEKIAGGIFIKK